MSDIEKLSLLAISGFHSPRNTFTDFAAPQLPVVIRAGDLTLNAAHSNDKFNITIQRKIPPLTTDIPHGVMLSIPLYYLSSIFIFNHSLHGHSMRLRLISPNRAFKLSGGAPFPAHSRYMLDGFGKPSMLYPCHLNDHFDLLGILQGREAVLHISGDMSMETLVDWAARLKDTAAAKIIPIQVLFDNPETGRVSQLQDLPARLRRSPEPKTLACPIRTPSNDAVNLGSKVPTRPAAMSTDPKQRRPSTYANLRKSARKQSKRSDDEDEWDHRRHSVRPYSPSRYYRPQYIPPEDPSRYYRPSNLEHDANTTLELREKMVVDEPTTSQSKGIEIKDEGLSDASTVGETPKEHQEDEVLCDVLDV